MLFGRAVEVELIESFVTGRRTDFGSVLVVAGEAGAGKSALLDAGAEIAGRPGRLHCLAALGACAFDDAYRHAVRATRSSASASRTANS